MKKLFVLCSIIVLTLTVNIYATVLKVGIGQPYTTIQSAINAAATGDTVKVLPGIYEESVTINKDIVVQGSGYETTKIQSNNSPAVAMNGGKLMWVSITSVPGDGIDISAGLITNVVVIGSGGSGIYFPQSSTGIVKNSVIISNAAYGVYGEWSNRAGTVTNSISWNNKQYGFYLIKSVTYSDGSLINVSNSSNVINLDPKFVNEYDFHIPPTSPSFDKGSPVEVDPDGSRSDMGYFGGKDTPVYPVVIEVDVKPLGNGQVQIQAKTRANY